MDIQKEKDAFLNVFQFFKSFKGIGFSEETEQFFLKKNKPNDAECLDVSNLNQMWRAWWARAKSQAVPEGFVLVPHDVAERCMGHISIAMCHPNNSNAENDVMQMDLDILESKVEAGAKS